MIDDNAFLSPLPFGFYSSIRVIMGKGLGGGICMVHV